MAQRIDAIDIAKGIAIIAVLVGHSITPDMPQTVISLCFTFHMPLFFIASGYFFKASTRPDRAFVVKNAKALLIPYVLTCAAVVLLALLRGIVVGEPQLGVKNALDYFVASLYGSGSVVAGMPEGVIAIGAVWFLLAMFWGKLFLAAANNAPGTPAIVVGLFAAGYLIGCDNVWLPLGIQPGMCATLFLWLGQRFRELGVLERGAVSPVLGWLAAGVWAYCIAYGGQLFMVANTYGNVVLDVLGGIAGSYCVLKASQWLEARCHALANPLRRLGLITLPVFCMHLVELDVFPWGLVDDALVAAGVPCIWVATVALRCVVVAVMTLVLWRMPRIVSGAFFASRKAPAPAKAA